MSFRRIILLFPLLVQFGCGHSLSGIPGFDDAAWRQDPYACRNQRLRLLPPLTAHRETLYGTRTADIDALLGQPDEEELNEQTEKTYYYYLEAGTQCEARHPRSSANKLAIHFGPTGIVTGVLLERPLPAAR